MAKPNRRTGGGPNRSSAPRGQRPPAPREPSAPLPVVELTLDRLAWGGDAIARLEDGRIVFVDAGVPGDRVRAQLTEDGKRFVRAHVEEILHSDAPTAPRCPTADRCGGCRFQGLDYNQELALKRTALEDMLRRLARDVEWPEVDVVPSPISEGYRERVRLRVNDAGETGYHARGSNDFVAAVTCTVLHPALEAARQYAGFLTAGLLRVHSFRLEWDAIRRMVVLEVPCDAQSWTVVRAALRDRLAKLPPPVLNGVADQDVTFSVTIRNQGRWEAIAGDGEVHRRFGDALVEQRSGNFAQANGVLNAAMRERVADLTNEGYKGRSQRVADFFGGAGNLSYALAATGARVVSVDHASEAVEAGKEAKRGVGVRSVASWISADLSMGPFDALKPLFESCDAIVLDPPRGGLAASFLAEVGDANARKMVYVSCDPPALARDISRLAVNGWRVKSVEAWDMFPRTPHVEVIASLYRI